MNILVINAGSSSVKFALFDFDSLAPTAQGLLDWAGGARQATITLTRAGAAPVVSRCDAPDYRAGVVAALRALGKSGKGKKAIRVVGHRLIHGGPNIHRPVEIDAEMKRTIARTAHLAPLHVPAGLDAIEATETALPGVSQVGVFDTAFFGQIPPYAYLYPVPYEWYTDWGIRRFGFHGTSHAYCTHRAEEMLDRDPHALRLVICHLGQGASATAVHGGVAVTNTMGFTPLEGFMMGTRSGTVDPGILLYVQREKGLSVDQLDQILHKKSGLLGISGLTSDFRMLEAAAAEGHERAKLALDMYAYRVRAMAGSLVVTLGGLDAMVFTGGIGEHSRWLRTEICRGLECVGVRLDPNRNKSAAPDCDLATSDSPARILLIHTREEYMIARQAKDLLAAGAMAG